MNTSDPDAVASSVAALPLSRSTFRVIDIFELLVGVLMAITWFASAVAHLANPYFFLSTIFKYEVVGSGIGQYVAMVLPYLQLFLAIALLSRWLVMGALFLSALLLLSFSCLQLSVIDRGLSIGCGCFASASETPITPGSVVGLFAAAILVSAAFVVRWGKNRVR